MGSKFLRGEIEAAQNAKDGRCASGLYREPSQERDGAVLLFEKTRWKKRLA